MAVLLDPDVARVFQSAESVNAVLRALVATMPSRRTPTERKAAPLKQDIEIGRETTAAMAKEVAEGRVGYV